MTYYQKSCQHLQNAMTALKLYTQKNQKKGLSLFSRFFSLKKKKSCLRAIDEIKTHRYLIQRLQRGTEEQKNLAKAVLNAIQHYNDVVSTLNKKRTWSLRHSPAFKPIELSLPITIIQKSHGQMQKPVESMQRHVLTKEETDVFRMKGITLLSHFYPSIAITQESVQKAEITTHMDQLANKLSVSTVLKPLPGESCVVRGIFHIFPNKKRSSPKNFELSFEATQTAFPDPLQYLGCFSDSMIPPCPLRIDQMPALSRCLAKKGAIANGLLPKGAYNLKAKEQLQQKLCLFREHHDTLLNLHRKLMDTLVKRPLPPHNHDELILLYRSFIKEFINKPTDQLTHEWLENYTLPPETVPYQASSLPHPNPSLSILGEALSRPCQAIIFQHLSENLGFMPPELSPFETKLQILLYRQLLTFFAELERESPLTIEWMKEQMLLDISVMTGSFELLDAITQEAKAITEELGHTFSLQRNKNSLINIFPKCKTMVSPQFLWTRTNGSSFN